MIETYEIQLFSKYLSMVSDATVPAGRISIVAVTVRRVVGDPQFGRIGDLDRKLRESKLGVAFGGWTIRREYTDEELARAEFILLNIPMTEVAAEEYGTEYRDLESCEFDGKVVQHLGGTEFRVGKQKIRCGLGARQVGSLRVPFGKFKKNRDLYRIWGGELIASARFASLVNSGQFSGSVLAPISNVEESDDRLNQSGASRRTLSQLVVQSEPLKVTGTRFGETPFDSEVGGYHRCPAGVIAGLRPISPLQVARSSWDGRDLCLTDVYVGRRVGLFRPYQPLVVSKRLFDAIQKEAIKGFQFEIVELT